MNTLTAVEGLRRGGLSGARGSLARLWPGVVVALVSIATLLCIAAWNGYPLLFFDSFFYIGDGFEAFPAREKALAYGLLIRAFSGFASLWPIVILQAAATQYLLGCLWRSMGFGARSTVRELAQLALLAVLTPLGWVVAHVMPDIFSALLLIGIYLLVFRRETLAPRDRIIVPMLFLLSNMVHNSNWVLSSLVLVSIAIGAIGWRWVSPRRLVLPAALVASAMTFMVGLNVARSQEVFLTRGGAVYLANRLAEDGILQSLLEEHCAEERYALCPFTPISTERVFLLFDSKSPLEKIGGWVGAGPEMRRMIVDSIRYYAKENIIAALNQVGNQLRSFELAEFIFPFSRSPGAAGEIRAYFPREYSAFLQARQQRETIASSSLASLHAVVVWAGALLGAFLTWGGCGEPQKNARSFMTFVWLGLLVNAIVCGVFSHFEFRYQARVVWLAPLCALMAWEASRVRRVPAND